MKIRTINKYNDQPVKADNQPCVLQLVSDRQRELSDSKTMVMTLVMGMKSLLYSLSSHGNTAVQRSPLPPGMVAQPTFGLRQEELEVHPQTK